MAPRTQTITRRIAAMEPVMSSNGLRSVGGETGCFCGLAVGLGSGTGGRAGGWGRGGMALPQLAQKRALSGRVSEQYGQWIMFSPFVLERMCYNTERRIWLAWMILTWC
jgi:hypothetical protein